MNASHRYVGADLAARSFHADFDQALARTWRGRLVLAVVLLLGRLGQALSR